LTWQSAQVVFAHPTSAVAATVTEATGITGDAVASLVVKIDTTLWPFVTLVASVILLAVGAFTLATAHRWKGSERRYRTDAATPTAISSSTTSRPHDAIDSWDDLSRGEDPTA
jgi:Tryptophan-associated transmembrane protein (Trp_oprn_chp)